MKKISTSWITQWGKDYLYHLKEIFQRKLTAGDNITIEDNVISASGGAENVQSDWNETDTTSDAYILNKPDLSTKQDTLTAGTNITIENNVISASGGATYDDTELRGYVTAIIDVLVDEAYIPTSADASVGTPTGDCFTSNGIAYANIRFTTTSDFSSLSGRSKILDGFPVPRHNNSCHITMYDINNGDMLHGYIGANGGVYVMLPPNTGGNTFNINISYPTTEAELNIENSVVIANWNSITPINTVISEAISDALTIIEPI